MIALLLSRRMIGISLFHHAWPVVAHVMSDTEGSELAAGPLSPAYHVVEMKNVRIATAGRKGLNENVIDRGCLTSHQFLDADQVQLYQTGLCHRAAVHRARRGHN